jgi:hypothetical protein
LLIRALSDTTLRIENKVVYHDTRCIYKVLHLYSKQHVFTHERLVGITAAAHEGLMIPIKDSRRPSYFDV